MSRASKYKPEFCEMLIKHGTEGLTFDSFAAVVKVHKDTLYEWVKKHDEFAEAKEMGRSELLLFHEKLMRAIAMGKLKSGNVTALIFTMKNCHGWRDKQRDEVDVIVKNEVTISPTDVQDRIKQIKERKP